MRVSKKRKILISYIFWLGVVFIGWYFLIDHGRKNLADEEKILDLRNLIQNKMEFYLGVTINGVGMKIELKENIQSWIISVFSNPKLARNFTIHLF